MCPVLAQSANVSTSWHTCQYIPESAGVSGYYKNIDQKLILA